MSGCSVRARWPPPPSGRAEAWSEMWTDWWRGPPPRADRGLVRYLVLDAIAKQPRHGYEIIQVIGERSGGAYRPSPGVVYPTLQMLEELGHAHTVTEADRKVYAITAEGTRDLDEHAHEVEDFYSNTDVRWEDHAQDVANLMRRITQIMRLVKTAMRRGALRAKTASKMYSILDEALRKLEDLLGEGP